MWKSNVITLIKYNINTVVYLSLKPYRKSLLGLGMLSTLIIMLPKTHNSQIGNILSCELVDPFTFAGYFANQIARLFYPFPMLKK